MVLSIIDQVKREGKVEWKRKQILLAIKSKINQETGAKILLLEARQASFPVETYF